MASIITDSGLHYAMTSVKQFVTASALNSHHHEHHFQVKKCTSGAFIFKKRVAGCSVDSVVSVEKQELFLKKLDHRASDYRSWEQSVQVPPSPGGGGAGIGCFPCTAGDHMMELGAVT